jgi:5,5'-dehydrodivanillate O-demethylase oxygenase subunit
MQNENTVPESTLQVDDLVRTGPATPAGRYLRQFWQPIYHSADLAAARPVPLRIMGQGFTLYRGESGAPFLVDERCPHRGAQLSAGWVEGDGLRCYYHGWKFAGSGQCLEQPAERSGFAAKVVIRSYPVREYLGFVFAYLGEGPPPELPLYPEFDNFDGLLEIDSYARRCNYFQNLENALDMSHVGFVHGDNKVAFNGIGSGEGLQAEESSWGVRYSFTRADGRQRIQQFGMPNIFYMLALPTDEEIGWQESLFWWVPVDDDLHIQFSVHRIPVQGEAAQRIVQRRQQRRSEIDLAHQDICEQILNGQLRLQDVDSRRVDLVRLQDDIAQNGQGRIADRKAERLGRADLGVAAVRRLWRREVARLHKGEPLKDWRRDGALVPAAWGLVGAPAQQFGLSKGAQGAVAVQDVRPYVEIQQQLNALHGAAARARV